MALRYSFKNIQSQGLIDPLRFSDDALTAYLDLFKKGYLNSDFSLYELHERITSIQDTKPGSRQFSNLASVADEIRVKGLKEELRPQNLSFEAKLQRIIESIARLQALRLEPKARYFLENNRGISGQKFESIGKKFNISKQRAKQVERLLVHKIWAISKIHISFSREILMRDLIFFPQNRKIAVEMTGYSIRDLVRFLENLLEIPDHKLSKSFLSDSQVKQYLLRIAAIESESLNKAQLSAAFMQLRSRFIFEDFLNVATENHLLIPISADEYALNSILVDLRVRINKCFLQHPAGLHWKQIRDFLRNYSGTNQNLLAMLHNNRELYLSDEGTYRHVSFFSIEPWNEQELSAEIKRILEEADNGYLNLRTVHNLIIQKKDITYFDLRKFASEHFPMKLRRRVDLISLCNIEWPSFYESIRASIKFLPMKYDIETLMRYNGFRNAFAVRRHITRLKNENIIRQLPDGMLAGKSII